MVSSYEAPSRYPKGQVSSCRSVNMSSQKAELSLSVCPFRLYHRRLSFCMWRAHWKIELTARGDP
ncbi:unnamed protein product [Prunus armeniaca]|uniref:Uncharacterized protein n=1 Tax=Prunus armeniaca TaxID=36596 RepID=A0A6J5WMA7_PRUAR|nr:unnamed protein product [Prunus armeniaca]CAB4299388.1 unnamed protein product [Prunus armeniaca]